MKLYVINLERSPDRLRHMRALFKQQGLVLTRQPAVDAATISDETYQELTRGRFLGDSLTKGELACFLSHRLVWQRIAEDSAAYAAVFEDDVLLSPHARLLLTGTDWIPQDAEIVKIETHLRFNRKMWLGPPKTVVDHLTLARLKSTHLCTGGYIISRQMAARLVRETEHIHMPVDTFLFDCENRFMPKRVLYQLDPSVVVQSDLPSIIQAGRGKRNATQKQQRTLRQTLRREIKRIINKGAKGLRGLVINTMTAGRWKRVPFDEQE